MVGALRRVLLMAAPSGVDHEVARLLQHDASLHVVRAFEPRERSRAASASRDSLASQLDRVDYLKGAFEAVDTLMLALPDSPETLAQGEAVIQAAKWAGVRRIVYLNECGFPQGRANHLEGHVSIEDHLAASDCQHVIIRPGVYMQDAVEFEGIPLIERSVVSSYAGDEPIEWVDADDVAAAVAICLRQAHAHNGRTFELVSEAKDYREVVQTISNVTGRPFHLMRHSPDDLLAAAAARSQSSAHARSWLKALEGHRPHELDDQERSDLMMLLGRPGKSWAQFVAEHVPSFSN